MSANAAIFMKNPETDIYSGVTVMYDGYRERMGVNLFENWQDPEDVEELCFGPDSNVRELGCGLHDTTWKSEAKSRAAKYKNLNRDEMENEGKQSDYFYLFENGQWFIYNKNQQLFEVLK